MHVWPTGNHKTEARNKSCFVLLRIILGKFSNRGKGGDLSLPLAENLMHKIVSSIYLFSLFIFCVLRNITVVVRQKSEVSKRRAAGTIVPMWKIPYRFSSLASVLEALPPEFWG